MKIKNWFKRQIVAFSIAISDVSRNLLAQNSNILVTNNSIEQDKNHGNLLDGLNKGVVNSEVRDLRWRTYKVLKASQNLKLKMSNVDSDGDVHYNAIKTSGKQILLSKVKLDLFDNYPLEMVVDNSEITIDSTYTMENKNLNIYDEVKKSVNEDGDQVATHGEIKANEYFATIKGERPIKIKRDFFPKFYIENFTKKINIRNINNEEKLIEFYVSKYPQELNPTSRLFLKKIETAFNTGNIQLDFFNINEVEFITYNTLGSDDFLLYTYEITKIDKLIEYDGFYVIKFLSKIINNGSDILSDYIEDELEIKYKNKKIKH